MKTAAVDFAKCAEGGCVRCAAAKKCDKRVIVKLDADEPAFIDSALCSGCGDCLPACPFSALDLIDG